VTVVRATVSLTAPVGLHARPAVKLTRLAKRFPARVRLRPLPDGDPVDAKSIVRVMGLKLRTGTTLEFEAEGERAAEAVEALCALVAANFEDGEHG